ncbi:MAG: hypothetical protein JNK12_04520 [Acidimicrobiales bacterium]|nr:hypothetical protein [Acidimicrobiales bacterium]
MRCHRLVPAAALVAVFVLVGAACSSDGQDDAGGPATTAAGDATSTTAGGGAGDPTPTTVGPIGASSIFQAACDGLLESPQTVRLDVAPLVEASGLAVSRANEGVLWAHNDSGDTARVFAFGEDGGRLGTFKLVGAGATDWEDMALGPDVDDAGDPVADRDALYVADFGDNDAVRGAVTLYRVSEPEVAAGAGRVRLDDVESFTYQYPDGPRDAEALFVDRTDGSFYVIEKSLTGGPVGIYRGSVAGWDAAPAVPVTLERVGTFRPGPTIAASVTGADMSPAGDAIAVRTYGGVHLFARPEGTSVADTLATEPCRGPVPVEAQGEAVALTPAGDAYFTLPEGSTPTLSRWAP